MKKNVQAVRGMNDILPDMVSHWQYVERALKKIVDNYGYEEIRFPVLEHTELFKRTIGSVTDIVEKEMYSFVDTGGENLSLRPEGTALRKGWNFKTNLFLLKQHPKLLNYPLGAPKSLRQ